MSQFEKYILIGKDRLENIFLKAKDGSSTICAKWIGILCSLFLPLIITVFTVKDYKWDFMFPIIIFVTAVLGVTIIILLCSDFKNIKYFYFSDYKSFDDIRKQIENDSVYKKENTLIILDIKEKKSKDGKIEYFFPVKRSDKRKNSYMFPYLKQAEKYKDSDGQINIEAVKIQIKEYFGIEIPIGINHIHELDIQDTSLNMEKLPIDFHFQYLHVYPESPFFKNYLRKIIEEKGKYEYKSIIEIKSDEPTIINNTIAVNSIQQNIQTIKRSIKMYANRRTGIVWNIDKNCNLNCTICAYGNHREKSMTLEQKKKVIDAMSVLDIDNIDFATGSSPNINELKKILEHAKDRLPNTVRKITATANVLQNIGIDFIKKNSIEVDITYDYPHLETSTSEHRPKDYNIQNFKIAETLIKQKIKVHAHVVIHSNNTDIEFLQSITDKLNEIGINEILFIRLMPVGNQSYLEYPTILTQKSTYEGVLNITNDRNNADIELHCALQGLNDKKAPCQLGCRKLGISQNGDVFTCPWAEHLDVEKGKNPFFIGNIVSKNFSFMNTLMQSERYKNTLNRSIENQPHCKIFAYMNGEDMFSKQDTLFS